MNSTSAAGRRFFWQGLLILLPVLALAVAGFLSLRQDRILAQHEAVEKAQALADQIAGVFWERLFRPDALKEFKDHAFRIDEGGHVLFPPPAPPVPVPAPLDPAQLTEPQRRLWTVLMAPLPSERTRAIANAREMLALSPAPGFAGPAAFRLAQLLYENGEHEEAARQFELVANSYPEAVGESGVPLGSLASFRQLQIAAEDMKSKEGNEPARTTATVTLQLQTLCSNLVMHPPFLAAHLLQRLSAMQTALGVTNVVEPWLQTWGQHEALRLLAETALAQAPFDPAATTIQTAQTIGIGLKQTGTAESIAVPDLFWFHAVDQSAAPQPAFSLAKRIGLMEAKGRNVWPAVTVSGSAPSEVNQPAPSSWPSDPLLDRFWLAARLKHPEGGYWIVCRALGLWNPHGAQIGSPALNDLKEGLPRLPAWLDYTVEIAGATFTNSNDMQSVSVRPSRGPAPDETIHRSGGNSEANRETPARPEILASAVRSEQGTEYLRVMLHFASPQLFYARQRTRTYLFGGLIGVAVLAALIGLFSARRAFLRQQQLGELKSNFVSSVSHELRAPIASMRLLAESLQRGTVSDPARQADYFRFLVQECRRLSALIENVLNFARIERGQKHYEFEPTDVVGLLQQTVKLMEPAATDKQVRLALDSDGDPSAGLKAPPLLDGPSIQQALVNLIDNALKHSPPQGTVTVGLRAATLPSSAGINGAPTVPGGIPCLSFFVQDHGPGIPAEDHERIFEQFYRRGSELRRETQGIGIGLSIVKHIAQAHAGRVLVESKIGQGSRFTLQLPLKPFRDGTPTPRPDNPQP
ncbi:MAG TPA: ATP-binding protein [Verrucomicrobiae bacterium]|nr:ATP-binding protein [Verrucomicrobiae bacterium]